MQSINDTVEDRVKFLIWKYQKTSRDFGLQFAAQETLRTLEYALFRTGIDWNSIVNNKIWDNRHLVINEIEPIRLT